VIRIEANLFMSVNAIALNDSRTALQSILRANNMLPRVREPWLRTDLRFRVARQLVHVLVARGSYVEAWSEAERAMSVARRIGSRRLIGIAKYLGGFVLGARGDPAALTYLAEADREWGGEHAFGRWVRYMWASVLRDHGEAPRATTMRDLSGVRIPWEDPLFELGVGRPGAIALEGTADERPFRLAASGLLLTAAEVYALAEPRLIESAALFERSELEHYRRGVTLTLVGLLLSMGEHGRAAALLDREAPALVRGQLTRWPWWYGPLAVKIAHYGIKHRPERDFWRRVGQHRPAQNTSSVLAAHGLSGGEIEVVARWVVNPHWSRRELAADLGLRESTVRNVLNRARRKMNCGPHRGAIEIMHRLEQIAPNSRIDSHN